MIPERDADPRHASSSHAAAQRRIRAALLTPHAEETPISLAMSSFRTQELAAGDILEVRDMAEVIARAEQIVAAPRSSRPSPNPLLSTRSPTSSLDIFDSLARPKRQGTTDDTAGPATPAPSVTRHAVIHQLPQVFMPAPNYSVGPVAARATSLVLTVPVVEEDAYYAPGGRLRPLAEQTIEAYRPEPTLLLRAAVRRKGLRWLALAALLPIAALGGYAFFASQDTAAAAASEPVSRTTIATATLPAAKPVVTAHAAQAGQAVAPVSTTRSVSAAALPTVSVSSSKSGKAGRSVNTNGALPTFDVNSLPSAKH